MKNESDFRKAGKQIASHWSPKTENRKKRCFTWNILRDVKREKWDGESDISRNEKMKDDLKKMAKRGCKTMEEAEKAKKIKMSWEKAKKRLKRGKCSIDMGEKNKNGRERQWKARKWCEMAMRDKKRREGIKNVDKREKVRLFTKKRER